jgi:hypothetical protein
MQKFLFIFKSIWNAVNQIMYKFNTSKLYHIAGWFAILCLKLVFCA